MEIDTSSQIPVFRSLGFQKKKESEISEIVNFAKRRTTSKTGKEKLAAAKISKKTIMTG